MTETPPSTEEIAEALQTIGLALLNRPEVAEALGVTGLPGYIAARDLLLLAAGVGRGVGRGDIVEAPRQTETTTLRDAAEQLDYSEEWTRQLGRRGELDMIQPAGERTAIEVEQASVDRFLDLRSLKAFYRQLDEEDRKCRDRIRRIIGSQTAQTLSRAGPRRSSTT